MSEVTGIRPRKKQGTGKKGKSPRPPLKKDRCHILPSLAQDRNEKKSKEERKPQRPEGAMAFSLPMDGRWKRKRPA
jgi:hypothetical protein